MSIPKHPTISLRRQSGFSIVSAIFLLVVIAGLGAAMLNISASQHTSSALDLEGTRAYHAARSGIEWGVYKMANPPAATCFTSPSSFVPATPTLSSFTVTVTCAPFTSTNLGVTVYQIQSTACNMPNAGSCPGAGGSTYYVQRRIQVVF